MNVLPTSISEKSNFTDTLTKIFEKQRAHKDYIRQTTASQRIEKLHRLKNWLFTNRVLIHEALYDDFRKPAAEVDSTEIYPVKAEIDHTTAHLRQWMKPTKVATPIALLGSSSYIQYEPKGVSLIMAPWNFPFNLAIVPLVSAIAAGCCAIVKPSEMTPTTSALIKKMIGELFNENEVAVAEGDAEVAQALLRLPFDHIFFTGSPQIGKIVMKAAAENLTSVTLELGGKSPVVVDQTADIADAAEKIVWGKFMNAGQICVSPDYLFVHKSKEAELVQALKNAIQKLFAGNASSIANSPDYARIVNALHRKRLQNLISDAVQKGAQVAAGGEILEDENYIAPTLLTRVNAYMQVMQEEIFGPVLPILTFEELEQVTNFIKLRDKPLALYVFSQSNKNTDFILNNTSSGGVCINECVLHYTNPHLPFGGVNTSGIGKAHGHYGFLDFSNQKAVLKQRTGFTSIKMIYPPYTDKVKRLVKLFVRWF
ncbi:aldehyde dehydrogenase family protein [Rhodocytophaga aerolata]|uniref:Aldehyde dehydrogenase n=1 Tax=Rhodocytophaga aerolata TaxID=455078 RepID=A0ABT8RFW1_9BACT|nr:aldehyde dehydrogenase family protein [Rhodocytophaga aerolata]MDO1450028.1 aldehyde dehydrogenase family protein [Rhodocytophaga aerolata]